MHLALRNITDFPTLYKNMAKESSINNPAGMPVYFTITRIRVLITRLTKSNYLIFSH